MSAKETKKIMLQAQIEAYGDGLDHNYLHPYMWTWKPHIMIQTIHSITTHTPLVHYLRKDFMHFIKKNLNTSQRIMKHSFQLQVRWI